MNTCKTCKWRHPHGYCTNPKLDRKVPLPDSVCISTDIGYACLMVGEDFGCIHHETKQPTPN